MSLRIDCDDCVRQHTPTCDDCVVTYLCDRQEGSAVIVELDELRSLRLLRDAGLVPDLRHQKAAVP